MLTNEYLWLMPILHTNHYHIFGTLFAVITQSLHTAISSFPPTGYQSAMMITESRAF